MRISSPELWYKKDEEQWSKKEGERQHHMNGDRCHYNNGEKKHKDGDHKADVKHNADEIGEFGIQRQETVTNVG